MTVILYVHPEDEDAVEEIECPSYAPDDIGFLWLYASKDKPSRIINLNDYAQVEFEG
jgi:hypothetical protein